MAQLRWDPLHYEKFADKRTQPLQDLLARIPLDAPRRIVDLGCGTGRGIRLLAARWPNAELTGVDSSVEMLARARERDPKTRWLEGDIATWQPPHSVDLIFANASLHWLPDHGTLLPRLLGQLTEGGALAVQMPRNYDAPSHLLMREVAEAGPWRKRLAEINKKPPVARAEDYHAILSSAARHFDIWETIYLQVLEGEDPVLDWVTATGLKPFLAALDSDERDAFVSDYRARLRCAYPAQSDGRTLFPFRRLFIVAAR